MLSSGQNGARFHRDMWDTLNAKHQWQGEVWNRRRNGELYPCWLSINAVTDAAGRVTHYVGAATDLSEFRKSEHNIFTLAFYDTLTGLPNRRLLLDRLRQAIMGSATGQSRGSLIFIDLDGFTILNETRGHASGDHLLTTSAIGSRPTLGKLTQWPDWAATNSPSCCAT